MNYLEEENVENSELAEEENLKQHLLEKAEISLLLDRYEDIFSDFDPRPFINRALSDDFLIEAKKAARDKEETLDLSFMIPKHKRNFEHEVLIKRRLRDHFKKHALLIEDEIGKIKKTGLLMISSGIFFIFLGAYTNFYLNKSLFTSFLIVLLEPAGWFTFWEGLNLHLFESKKKKPDLEFYHKMTRCEISFHSY